jgi:hypothetical protein
MAPAKKMLPWPRDGYSAGYHNMSLKLTRPLLEPALDTSFLAAIWAETRREVSSANRRGRKARVVRVSFYLARTDIGMSGRPLMKIIGRRVLGRTSEKSHRFTGIYETQLAQFAVCPKFFRRVSCLLLAEEAQSWQKR